MTRIQVGLDNRLRFRLFIFCSIILILWLSFWLCLPIRLFEEDFSIVVLDQNGELLGAAIASDEQWRFPPIKELPDKFKKAITCFEDGRFFYHPGVDIFALIRAAWQNISSGQIKSGASTLTMQVIRLSRKNQERTVIEKLIEIILALRLEMSYDKEQILSLFASYAPFGGNIVGIEAAAWRYFGRGPDLLSWAEHAMLAILPNSPSLIHPGRNRELLKQKRDWLLDRLKQKGYIDSITCELAKQEALPQKPHPLPQLAPHLLSRVQSSIDQNSRSRVFTTLRKDLQIDATNIAQRHYKQLIKSGINNVAALILEVETGNVLAYVGNVLNLSTQDTGGYVDIIMANRSTGSILKPILYAAMIDAGELLPTQLVPDIPTRIGGFRPQNFSKTFQGAVPAYMALARSLNIPSIRMLQSFGVDRFSALLKDVGMTTLHRPAREYGLSLILGGAEGKLWELTGIYASMARVVQHSAQAEKKGHSLFSAPSYLLEKNNQQAQSLGLIKRVPVSSAACWLSIEAMIEVERPQEQSTWQYFTSTHKVAWKTGTSYGFRDAWAMGITPDHAVGVWVGNASGEGRPELVGIQTAAPLLFDLFDLLPQSDWFITPVDDLIEIEVCAKSGFRQGLNCATTKKVLAPQTGIYTEVCPYCKLVHLDPTQRWQVNNLCQRIAEIVTQKWFVLPPHMEWYYRTKHTDYQPLPHYREDCIEQIENFSTKLISLIHPIEDSKIYIPLELSGQRGETVCLAAHRDEDTAIYWHLDREYIGMTVGIHQMSISPPPGQHTLTLIDENGDYIQNIFTILAKDKEK